MANVEQPDEQVITLTPRQVKAIITGIVSAVLFLGGIAGSGILRVDKFGHSDHLRYVDDHNKEHALDKRTRHLEHSELEADIRDDMPPDEYKLKMSAVERGIRKYHPEFEPAMGLSP